MYRKSEVWAKRQEKDQLLPVLECRPQRVALGVRLYPGASLALLGYRCGPQRSLLARCAEVEALAKAQILCVP